ncbi:ATP-dependent DNA helicase RecG [Pseudoroseicyclus tamaricis]|uniref:ATP-dependent DNA helicase RecG n=1 Tax=Pseudoroseicyclus tamaricis TaxID=2705421 RepID=A0A6B2JHT0_9RHOB|nr:ATP-dependent DNA helicase RecG [Pseudoroseicyclus tamaricis]NDV00881.1 ATP-dependent DNA helicase RecG [Pseudoroseicyclus tamaricis]
MAEESAPAKAPARGRPEVLWPLFASLTTLDGIGDKTAALLAPAGIEKPRDMLYTLPHTGVDRAMRRTVRGLTFPTTATLQVRIGAHHAPRVKGRPHLVEVEDEETSFHLVFFHAGSGWLMRQLPPGETRVVSGKLELYDGVARMVHPDHIVSPRAAETIPPYEPVYPLVQGVTQKLMFRATRSALGLAPDLPEWADKALVAREGWPSWRAAIGLAHSPVGAQALDPADPARRRLAYDEFFAHQMTLALARAKARRGKGRPSTGDGRLREKVLASLPYTPTGAQLRAGEEIAADMASGTRMNRLLQGDVGSGKTLVALLALLNAVESGGQGALMAPTEILARQHAAGLAPLVMAAGVRMELLTGRDTGQARAEKLAALAEGRIQILVGTHAIFQAEVTFRDLRLAVVDEQHRFGVRERMGLGAKGRAADMLVMTATPIPRSLALAQYGDMDVSVLDEKPPGRKPITTAMVSTGRLGEVLERLTTALDEGRQVYWVCPLVEESETSDLVAAEQRFTWLRARLGEGRVGLVHGQLPPAEKDAAMARFAAGETGLLVATTVIEVGVDVPNASIMVIEQAESFGLAQLHQLRGRVGRGTAESTCLLLYRAPLSETARRRLEILRQSEDGFRIAEEDLAIRGYGDLIGTAQSGMPRFRIADPERQGALMKLAQDDARALLAGDPELTSSRGEAARTLLWLTEQDRAIRLLGVG